MSTFATAAAFTMYVKIKILSNPGRSVTNYKNILLMLEKNKISSSPLNGSWGACRTLFIRI